MFVPELVKVLQPKSTGVKSESVLSKSDAVVTVAPRCLGKDLVVWIVPALLF